MILFGYLKGTCFGDSGSPFIVKKSGEERLMTVVQNTLDI